MKTFTIAISFLIGLGFIVPVQSDHGCNGTVTQIEVDDETLYVDDRSSLSGNHADIWFYIEQNGVEGLQSGGDNAVFIDQEIYFADACHHGIHDRLIM